ncbi:hypothetical protein DV738_g5183, partial [Chaetothyriales sp. CBS 135597]
MDLQEFLTIVPDLTGLELAVLLSLVAKQHFLVYADEDLVEEVAEELALITTEVFELSCSIVGSDDLQSPARFGEAILDEQSDLDEGNDLIATLHSRIENVSFASGPRGAPAEQKLDSRMVSNVVIAKDFNTACDEVQFQVLELISRNRIISKTTVHPTPMTFLFIPVVSSETMRARLNHHLNDRIFMSLYHSAHHGFPNLEDMIDSYGNMGATTGEEPLVITKKMIDGLRQRGDAVAVTPEIRRYLQDLIVFLRVEWDVDGGVTPNAGVNLLDLSKHLATLHGIDFVTPSLIAIAAKKVYTHRLIISPRASRGSAAQPVVWRTPEEVIESVIDKVDCPL